MNKRDRRKALRERWETEAGQSRRQQVIEMLQGQASAASETRASATESVDPSERLDLRVMNLLGETLDGADLRSAQLQGANLARASLKGANLAHADLRDAFLRHTDLTDANLRGANLDGAIMEDTALHGADLTDAYVTERTIVVGTTELPPTVHRAHRSPWLGKLPPTLTVPTEDDAGG